MRILDGKVVSESLQESLIPRIKAFQLKNGRAPHLAVVIVGNDSASQVYVKNKDLACQKVGIKSTVLRLDESIKQSELNGQITKLNQDETVDAILVQFPLPKQLSKKQTLELIAPEKDADGLTHKNMGALFASEALVKTCTPNGVMKILNFYKVDLEGKNAVVIGKSTIVGKPMAILLMDAGATVTVCHSKTKDLRKYTSIADVLVVAVGKPRFLGKNDIKKDSVVIDVGIHRDSTNKLCGDVRFEELVGWADSATPVPGGVGPMTIACLLENAVILAEKNIENYKEKIQSNKQSKE